MIRAGFDWFDRWVRRGDFSAVDVGVYRILFALVLMLTFPDFEWIADYPDSLWVPPLGPLQLLGAVPSHGVLVALELLLAVSTTALLLGYRTRTSSVAVSALLIVGFGLWNSVGKIDHNMIMFVVPAVMAFSGWGGRFSVDALRTQRAARPVPQWPVRFLGLLVAVSFVTAARPKLYAGWLSPDTQAVLATLFSNYHVEGRQQWLAGPALQVQWALGWELVDWATVGLELALVFSLISWRLFRVTLALACLFHLGVYLLMNIGFYPNVVAYGAFVLWSRLAVPSLPPVVTDGLRKHAVTVLLLGAGLLWSASRLGNLDWLVGPLVVVLGAVVAVWYLGRLAWALVRHVGRDRHRPLDERTDVHA